MHVRVLYNQAAGRSFSASRLRQLIEDAGHSVLEMAARLEPEQGARKTGADLVVDAGGDGTVAKAARLVAGTPVPLVILPLGTANNVAFSLGLTAPVPELIRDWGRAPRLPFDLGRAAAGSEEWLVVEGLGCGWVPAAIAAVKRQSRRGNLDAESPGEEIHTALRIFETELHRLAPQECTVTFDEETVSGEFLAVEVLNVRSIGPNLTLSRGATPTDGYFDVVMAGADDRTVLMSFLEARRRGRVAAPDLPIRRARRVSIASCGDLHVDDERVDVCHRGALSIDMAPGGMTVLGRSAPTA